MKQARSVSKNASPMWLMLFLIVYSGNPTLNRVFSKDILLIACPVLLFFLMLARRRSFWSKSFFRVGAAFACILFFQAISFSFFPVITISGFFLRLFMAFAFASLIYDFPMVYIKAMVFAAALSLIIFIPYRTLFLLGYNPLPLLVDLARQLGTAGGGRAPFLFHVFITDQFGWDRNAGLCGEPGFFAGYLLLAIIFLGALKLRFSGPVYKKYMLVLTAALLTTQSTTGYLVYPLALLFHYSASPRRTSGGVVSGSGLLKYYVILPIIIVSLVYAYKNIDFLQEKIAKQVYEAASQEDTYWYQTRIGTLLFDWRYIKQRPVFGWGLNDVTRFALNPEFIGQNLGQGNGMSDFIAKFGAVGFLVWLWAVYTALRRSLRLSRGKTFLLLIVLMILLQGEAYLEHPLFLSLMFVGAGDIRHYTVSAKNNLAWLKA